MNREGDGVVGEREAKVLFLEGDQLRAIRGILIGEDECFICLRRRDRIVRIGKSYVVKIEKQGDEEP